MSNTPAVSGRASRAARAYLNWKQADLANIAGVSVSSIRQFEAHDEGSSRIVDAIYRAFKNVGVELYTDVEGEGIYFRSMRKRAN